MTRPKSVASIGECMIELSQADDGHLRLAYAGDTANTAIYLARRGGDAVAVDYVTALGDDPYSDDMADFLASEGLGTRLIRRLPGRLPGLYMIRTDAAGERQFHYWRSAAAARDLLGDDLASLAPALAQFDMLYYSAITLSILTPAHRLALLGLIADARTAGTRIVFDSNYRPAGWPSTRAARMALRAAYRQCDIALPTFEDEQKVFGDSDPQAALARLNRFGIAEVALKGGAEGAWIGGRKVEPKHVPAEASVKPVDTTGAGDSFNGAYLAARLRGESPVAAAQAGNRLAARVIQHRGAIIPREAMG